MNIDLNNVTIAGYWDRECCEYDDQGRIVKCNQQDKLSSKESLKIEYDEYSTRVKRYQDEQDKEKSYSILTYGGDTNNITSMPLLLKQDYYNNQIENKMQKTFSYGDNESINGINYYDKDVYSTISQDIDPETNETYNVSYWRKNKNIEEKDFSVTFNEGIYNIEKFDRFGESMDIVDLGTLVDNYYNNPKCDCCGEPIRLANWNGSFQYKNESVPFEGDCKLDKTNDTYELDNLFEKICKDDNINYDDIGNFDGQATCKSCGVEL